MRNIKTQLKFFVLYGDEEQQLVAKGILRDNEAKEKLSIKLIKDEAKMEQRHNLSLEDPLWWDYRTTEQRLGHLKGTFLERYWIHILGAGVVWCLLLALIASL